MKSRRFFGLIAAFLLLIPTSHIEASALENHEQFIVEFISGVNPSVEAKSLQSQGAQVSVIYNYAINGVSASMSPRAAAALAKNPRVKSINREEIATLQSFSEQNPTKSWGIDRVDQRNLPLNSKYRYENVANSVTIYIFDTGLNSSLSEFAGRVSPGRNFMTDKAQSDTSDCNGHGTHVAGTALGTNYGVAKSARVVPVRVLNCQGSGTATAILNGIDWVISQHDGNLGELAVANMSLGFSTYYGPVDTAVRNLVADGVATAVAAGNSNVDACTVTPASTPTALTVGASTSSDSRSSFSNWGGCLDIFAPGSSITSLNKLGTAEAWNGTSMASPHVAGAAALLLSKNPLLSPEDIRTKLMENASIGKLISTTLSGSPNRLLHTLDRLVVYLDPNNGQSASSWTDNQVSTLTLPSPTKAGHTLAGWFSAQSGGVLVGVGGSVITPNASATLYAQWTPTTASFTVTYDGNTNTSGSAPSDSNSYSSGALVTVLGGGSLVKSGFSFAGWCTAAIAAGSSCSSPNISYQPNNTFSISSNVTLYAQWTPTTASFTVTYDGNTNTSGSAPSDSNSYSSGALVTVLGGGSLVKSGFSFAGWCTAAIAAGSSCSSPNISYQPNNTFSISSNATLYAQWTASLAPSQPSPPVLSISSPNSIRVNWVAPSANGAAITRYELRVLRNGAPFSTVTVGSVTSHNLLGLPRGRYQVSVRAFNGLWSIQSALSNEIRL